MSFLHLYCVGSDGHKASTALLSRGLHSYRRVGLMQIKTPVNTLAHSDGVDQRAAASFDAIDSSLPRSAIPGSCASIMVTLVPSATEGGWVRPGRCATTKGATTPIRTWP